MEEKYPVTHDQENIIKRLFKLWDQDGDGVVSFEEFTKSYKQVLLKDSEYKVKNDFQSADENEDQNLDFTEFKNFFLKIVEGDLLDSSKIRKFKKFLQKNEKVKEQLENPVLHKSSVTVNVGEAHAAKTKLDIKVLFNTADQEKHLEHISKGLHIQEGEGTVIVRIQSKTGSDIVEKLKKLVDDIKQHIKSFEFGKVIDELIDSFKFQFYYDEETVSVAITTDHNFVTFLKFAAEYVIQGYFKNLSLFLQVELLHAQDFSEAVKQIDETSFRQFVSKNFKMIYKLHSTCPALFQELMKKFDEIKKDFGTSDSRVLINAFVLYSIWVHLIQNEADITYNYKSLSTLELLDFLTTFKPKKIFELDEIKLQQVSGKITELSEGKVQKFSFAKDVTELLKSGLIANFSVSAVIPHVIVTVHGKTSGFKSLLEFVQNKAKAKDAENAGGSGLSGSESD